MVTYFPAKPEVRLEHHEIALRIWNSPRRENLMRKFLIVIMMLLIFSAARTRAPTTQRTCAY